MSRKLRLFFLSVLAVVFAASSAFAAYNVEFEWIGGSSGKWENVKSWTVNTLEGISVNVLENSNFDKEKDIILLALKEQDQPEILYKLSNIGCKNIVLITKELRRELLYYYI